MSSGQAVSFGASLRTWREARGLSQLRLATKAEVSQRHISFLETGRSHPSREMVIHLGRALRVPLKAQNELLVAAGLAPEFTETRVEDLAEVGEALQFMLAAHEPNMALVIDHTWNVVFANDSALRFSTMLAPDPPLFHGQLNTMLGMFHPDGLQPHVVNRAEVEPMLLWRLANDLDQYPTDERLAELYAKVRSLSAASPAVVPAHRGLVGSVCFATDAGDITLFSCLASMESAVDLTVSGLRVETFFPADAASRQRWGELMVDQTTVG